ncbi:suppressor of fused domain protein [Paenibacillus sp. PR3]|uniref:Suppressor of fused domain protein n=1 Tax=Paenibacillus terricola TaxID=2763503 RepID=A0ABR8N171_9BACL|nr:suppressor of fused domain protein [Paenibacillus terricola]MBD3920224.1 suppressor of fused domain protein [Paenibacillus terricola]
MKYTEYLEHHLGNIEYGWSKDSEGNNTPFQVVKYSGGPFSGTVTYSTLGLSNVGFISPISKKLIRQELIFVSYSNFGDKNIPGLLQQVGARMLNKQHPYLRGDVIGPYGKLFDVTELEALYVTKPVYFSDSFHTFNPTEGSPIVQTWLVPITANEANFIANNGWDKFEDKLVDINPDLVDFNRSSIIP